MSRRSPPRLDPWWNPAVEDQATDRAHRIGQSRPVTVIRLIAQGTIEEAVLALHAEKRDSPALARGHRRGGRLSAEDLIELVRRGTMTANAVEGGEEDERIATTTSGLLSFHSRPTRLAGDSERDVYSPQ